MKTHVDGAKGSGRDVASNIDKSLKTIGNGNELVTPNQARQCVGDSIKGRYIPYAR